MTAYRLPGLGASILRTGWIGSAPDAYLDHNHAARSEAQILKNQAGIGNCKFQ